MRGVRSPQSYEAALFDVDGTLVDSLEMILAGLGDAYESFAPERPSRELIASLMGMPLRAQMRLFSLHEPTEEEVEARMTLAIDSYERHAHLESNFEPAIEALRVLKRAGLKIALVTSRNAREVKLLLKHFPAADHVDAIVCASDVERPKPAPDPALLACQHLGVNPAECVFIGDSIFDLQCAQAAGMDRIAVLYGAGREDALRDEHPNLTLDTPEDLYQWALCALREPCLDARPI